MGGAFRTRQELYPPIEPYATGRLALDDLHTMHWEQCGAPEGVLAASALRCIGGQMQARLLFRNDDERARATRCGITDFDRKYGLYDLASGNVMFAATGVTNGTMLKGVRRFSGGATTHSVVMRSQSGTVRYVEAKHNFERKTGFDAVDR